MPSKRKRREPGLQWDASDQFALNMMAALFAIIVALAIGMMTGFTPCYAMERMYPGQSSCS
jgi:hypothetical protein